MGHRLYCTNLPDKLRKYDLRISLYTLFSTYGTVLDVVAMKTKKMRGQAHIVFKDIQASTQAMRALQGFDFFGKEMVCDFRDDYMKHTSILLLTFESYLENYLCKGSFRYPCPLTRHVQPGVYWAICSAWCCFHRCSKINLQQSSGGCTRSTCWWCQWRGWPRSQATARGRE